METNPERHFYLYAKDHYKKGDMEKDLLKILGYYCNADPERLTIFDVNRKLLELAHKHIEYEHHFFQFMKWLINGTTDSKGNIHYGITESCLSVLSLTKITDVQFKFGEPDPEVLPLKEKP